MEPKTENVKTEDNTQEVVVETPGLEEVTTEVIEKSKALTGADFDKMFKVGYTVRVGYKILEGGKERIQPFEGVVISKRGEGVSKTFMVRRNGAKGIGVERIFQLFSPKIAYIEVVKKAKARRSKLYFLREDRSKQDSKIKEIA